MSEEDKAKQTALDVLKDQTKQHIKEVLGLSFSDWSDETMQKFDPAIATLQHPLRDVYTDPSFDQARVESVLNTINNLLGEPDQYKESNLNDKSTEDLRTFTLFVKTFPWLLKQATPEDFSSFVDIVGKHELPACLTSDDEVSRLNIQFGNKVTGEDQHMFSSQPEPGRLQPISTFGEAHIEKEVTATDMFLDVLKKENSLSRAINQVTQQFTSK